MSRLHQKVCLSTWLVMRSMDSGKVKVKTKPGTSMIITTGVAVFGPVILLVRGCIRIRMVAIMAGMTGGCATATTVVGIVATGDEPAEVSRAADHTPRQTSLAVFAVPDLDRVRAARVVGNNHGWLKRRL